jgi:hypothetical protein
MRHWGSLLAACVACAGYFVVAPAQARIAQLNAQADAARAQLLADGANTRDAERLRRLRGDLAARLAGIELGTDRAAVISAFLRDVEARASAHDIRLVSVEAESGTGAVARAAEPFASTSLDLVLQGRYGAILETIAALSRSRVLMTIRESSIDRAKGRQDERSPVLSVQLKVAVYSLQLAPPGPHATDAT